MLWRDPDAKLGIGLPIPRGFTELRCIRALALEIGSPIPGEPTKLWCGRVAELGSKSLEPRGLALLWRSRFAVAIGSLVFLGIRSGSEAREPVSSSPAREFLLMALNRF